MSLFFGDPGTCLGTEGKDVGKLFSNGKMYNVGHDEYGQQYFIEYIDIHGKLVEFGCGAYNPYYLDVIDFLSTEGE